MENPLISVLVPMYNVEKYVERCIKSIMNQTYTNLEIVLLDDSSKDKTYEIAKKFAEKDSRIKLLKKENEANISKTRNYLLEHFSGEYFVFVDSDDVIEPNYVEKLFTTLVSTGADIVSCHFFIQKIYMKFDKLFSTKFNYYSGEDIIPQMILNNNINFMLWNKIYKKELLGETKFSTNVKFGEDLIFLISYMKKCKTLVSIDDKLYHYMLRSGSEIHQHFSEKHKTFIRELAQIAETEEDENISSAIKAWLSFSSVGFCFFAKLNKKKDDETIKKLKSYANLYKSNLFNNKKTLKRYKIIETIGLATWCKMGKSDN